MYVISEDENTLLSSTHRYKATVSADGSCGGCAFDYTNCPTIGDEGSSFCTKATRNDERSIIWVLDDRKQKQDNTPMTNTTNTTDTIRKAAGFTLKIEWTELHKWLGCMVDKKFYTTEDALDMHMSAFAKQGIVPTITKL